MKSIRMTVCIGLALLTLGLVGVGCDKKEAGEDAEKSAEATQAAETADETPEGAKKGDQKGESAESVKNEEGDEAGAVEAADSEESAAAGKEAAGDETADDEPVGDETAEKEKGTASDETASDETAEKESEESAEKDQEAVSAIEKVIRLNLEATENEEVDKMMATIHPDSPIREGTRRMTTVITRSYDLDYELNEVEVLDVGAKEAKVHFVQTTKKISGPQFRDNRITGVHTLRKDKAGNWKLWNTKPQNNEFLD